MPEIFDQLENLVISDHDFAKLHKRIGRFCIFEAIGIVHGEVRLGNFLAVFLQPAGSHGYGPAVLRMLLMEGLRCASDYEVDTGGLTPLTAHLMSFETVSVLREFKNIDILVKVPQEKLAIAIELKIGSPQGLDQLTRYRAIMETDFPDWQKLYIFLTVHDEQPKDPTWIPLRYSQLVPALEKVDATSADPRSAAAFQAFLDMLKRHYVNDTQLDKIAHDIWARHKEALEFLIARRPDIQSGIFAELLADAPSLAAIANSYPGAQYQFEATEPHTPDIIRLACSDWDQLPGFHTGNEGWTPSSRLILFELKKQGQEFYAVVYLGPGPHDLRNAIANAVLQNSRKYTGSWTLLVKQTIFTEGDIDGDGVKQYVAEKMAAFCQMTAQRLTPIITPVFHSWAG